MFHFLQPSRVPEMFDFTRKLRGNPTALATTLACSICLLIGIGTALVPNSKPCEIVAGALIGAAAGLLITAVVSWLSQSSLDTIPYQFKAAALNEISAKKFYRANNEIEINMSSPTEIIFTMRSHLVKIREGAEVPPPDFEGMTKQLSVSKKSWKLDDFEQGFENTVPLNCEMKEELVVVFEWREGVTISDTHRWNCPIDGFSLLMLPHDGFRIKVGDLSKRALTRCPCNNGTMYKERNASFSHHGFCWTIEACVPA